MKIAFMGKMGSGKTTAARYLVDRHGWIKLSFADPVKIATAQMLNQLSAYIQVYGIGNRPLKQWTLEDIDKAKKDPTIRHLLQFVGTELGREYIGYDRVWIDMLLRDAERLDHVVNDDLRFPNEAEALKENGFKIIKIERPMDQNGSTTQHVSETALDNYEPDAIVYNNHSIERFYRDIDFVLKFVLKPMSQENTRRSDT